MATRTENLSRVAETVRGKWTEPTSSSVGGDSNPNPSINNEKMGERMLNTCE